MTEVREKLPKGLTEEGFETVNGQIYLLILLILNYHVILPYNQWLGGFMAKISYRFPFKNQNSLTITFKKRPSLEDWQNIKKWLEFWGDNLCEDAPQPSVEAGRADAVACSKCGEIEPVIAVKTVVINGRPPLNLMLCGY